MSRRRILSLQVFFWLYVLTSLACAQPTYDDPMCIIDSTKEATAMDNYVDCTTDVMVKLDKTKCCKIDTAKGCCKPDGNWEQMKLIGIILGCVTACLAVFLIYWFWCRKNNPIVHRAGHFVTQRFHRVQEACSCCGCCRRAVEKRRLAEEMKRRAQEVPAFNLPEEASNSDPTFDKFWNGPLVKS